MARTPKPKPSPNDLLEAIRFLSLVTKSEGNINETHIVLSNNFAQACTPILSAGCKIKEDLSAAPHNTTLLNALSKCGQNVSITQLDAHRLSIKSDKFKAIVPCIDSNLLNPQIPDAPIAEINDKFKIALESVGILASEEGDRVHLISVLMNGPSVIATNGFILLEHWHGLSLPPGIAIPKTLCNVITKTSKKLSKFGFSKSSVTFYFEDESWVKSSLFADKYPDVNRLLQDESNPKAIPDGFFDALAAVAPFTGDGQVWFRAEKLCSHATEGAGAVYECEGLPGGVTYSAKQLALLKGRAQKWDFLEKGKMVFFGDRVRGLISGRG